MQRRQRDVASCNRTEQVAEETPFSVGNVTLHPVIEHRQVAEETPFPVGNVTLHPVIEQSKSRKKRLFPSAT